MEQRVAVLSDGVAVLYLEGKLNMVAAGTLRAQIAELVAAGHSRVAIDLKGVDFIDSTGLGALVSGLKTARDAGGDLRIAAPSEQVQLVLSLTQMERVLPPYPDPDGAFADLPPAG